MQSLRLPAHSAAGESGRAPATGATSEPPEDDLFSLADTRSFRGPLWSVATVSVAGHLLVAALLVLVPIFLPESLIERPETDFLRVLIYDPPPPPPAPLPKGAPEGGRARPAPRAAPEPLATPTPPPSETRLEAPVEVLRPSPDASGLSAQQVGSPTGSDSGVPEGMEEGVEGGVVGGVPGGVLGGVIGGTGTGPVPVSDYDAPPRLIRQVKPKYPPDAFVKKVTGVVVIDVLIDSSGRVVRARIVQSVPMLDAAALECVQSWVFVPAYKKGRPVATIARAPVTFRIY